MFPLKPLFADSGLMPTSSAHLFFIFGLGGGRCSENWTVKVATKEYTNIIYSYIVQGYSQLWRGRVSL